ncbi:macrophage mannose receptor 1-like [Chelmon rostratus]|uniref:macrophage mannose receptor 1-like n=1 Tax=Chelmon rostratus TaxID=109905 RepID=UPI001BE5363E|nr:macrophage mannose receptor 1-like [Chelmon rostratus]
MNPTITLKMRLLLFLLCSGIFHFTVQSNHLRFFRFNMTMPRIIHSSVLKECKRTNESLVTLYDEEDAWFVANFTSLMTNGDKVWLGLQKSRNITWSDGSPVTFNVSSVNSANGAQKCEAMDNDTWRGYDCSERKPFMCYDGKNYTLVRDEKDWCQALQYCRKHFSDLVSISNETQNLEVIEEGNKTNFWIGLLHDEWEWQDKSCSSYRKWDPLFNPDEKCTVQRQSTLYAHGCDNTEYTFCSKGFVRIKVIKEKQTWEQAFDYCRTRHTGLLWIEDGKDQQAVEQWLNHTEVPGPFWIGLRQSRVFGFWIWTSDRAVSYSNWKDGKQPELPLSNHCGVITRDAYTWSDEHCLFPHYFLCEEEISFN